MAELDYLDGWARMTWMQYGSISQSLWLNGEMAASIEDSMSAARGGKAGVALVARGEGAAFAPVEGADTEEEEEAEEDIISLESERASLDSALRTLKGAAWPATPHVHATRGVQRHQAAAFLEVTARPNEESAMESAMRFAAQAQAAHPSEASAMDSAMKYAAQVQQAQAQQQQQQAQQQAQQQSSMPSFGKTHLEGKARVGEVEQLRLAASQQQLAASQQLLGAVRSSQAAQVLEFRGTNWEAESPWRRFWLGRHMELEAQTNSALEAWQVLALSEGELKLSMRQRKLNPLLQQPGSGGQRGASGRHRVLQRKSLRAEFYAFQCWKAQNAADYMLALGAYQESAAARAHVGSAGEAGGAGGAGGTGGAGGSGGSGGTAGLDADQLALLKVWMPSLTERVVSLGSSLAASKVLLDTPDAVLQAFLMWSPSPTSPGPADTGLERGRPVEAVEPDAPDADADVALRVKQLKRATHVGLPPLAMQFANALLYRNYFARLLLTRQLQSREAAAQQHQLQLLQRLQAAAKPGASYASTLPQSLQANATTQANGTARANATTALAGFDVVQPAAQLRPWPRLQVQPAAPLAPAVQ